MARRLTTNQEIAGSIPASVTKFLLLSAFPDKIFVRLHRTHPEPIRHRRHRRGWRVYGWMLGIGIFFRIATWEV
jgi:hypothetical protein